MQRKKKLLGGVSLILAAVLAIGSSLAYFSDREVTTAKGTAGSLDISVDGNNINMLGKDGKDILNPGDLRISHK